MRYLKQIGTAAFVLIAVSFAGTSVQADQPNEQRGVAAGSASAGSDVDSVDLMTGNLFISIPLPILSPQRGGRLNYNFALTANSVPWTVVNSAWAINQSRSGTIGNLQGGVGLARGWDISFHRTIITNLTDGSDTEGLHFLVTSDGASHHLQRLSAGNYVAVDDTGYRVIESNPDSYGVYQSAVIIDRQGNQYQLALDVNTSCKVSRDPTGETATICESSSNTTNITDVNGNVYTLVGANNGPGMDTMGRTPPTQLTGVAANSAACQSVAGLPIASTATIGYLGYKGSSQAITECYSTYTIQTNFAQKTSTGAPIVESSSTKPLMVTAVMPDGEKYTFDYDSYGNLTYVGLPKGGSIRYVWETINQGVSTSSCTDQTKVNRAIQSRTLNDGMGHSYIWNYQYGTLQSNGTLTNTMTDANGNDADVVYSAFANANAGGVTGATACHGLTQTSTRSYRGTGSNRVQLYQVDTTYQAAAVAADRMSTVDVSPIVGNVYPTIITNTDLVAGRISKKVHVADTGLGAGAPIFGETVQEKVYDWGQGAPGPLLKEIDTSYLWQSDARYLTAGMVDLPASITMKDGNGNQVSRVDYGYDGSVNLALSGITLQHVAAPNPVRGNITTVSKWLNTRTNSAITKPLNFYDTGEPVDDIQPANWNLDHRTEFKYDVTGTYVVEIDQPSTHSSVNTGLPTVAHISKATYDFDTGLGIGTTDQNKNVASYDYDAMNRPIVANFADGGQTNFLYGLTTEATLSKFNNTSICSGDPTINTCSDIFTTFDGLGRKIQAQQATASGVPIVQMAYDGLGHATSVSNPYYSAQDPTDGITVSQYDALGRVTRSTMPDNSVVINAYSQVMPGVNGICAVAQDEAGKSRETCKDALGRLTAVFEDPSGTKLETDYAYTTPAGGGQQITITQKGQSSNDSSKYRVRTFLYDSVGRLLSGTNPETGTIAYTYDDNGNVLTKTDARSTIANYSYDALNRLELVTFTNPPPGTPNGCWIYDVSNYGALSFTNPVGRLVVASEGCGTVYHGYSYDTVGRITLKYQCDGDANSAPANCGSQVANYDYVGDMKSLTYQNGYTVNYRYDQAGKLLSATDGNGYIYASGMIYAANGAVAAISTPNFNYNYVFNKRFQPAQIAIGSVAKSLLVKDYNYGAGNDDGDVLAVTDENDGSRSEAFSYDSLNRVVCAQAGVTALGGSCTGSGAWGDSYSYDDWGNLTAKTATQGRGEQITETVGTNNHVLTAAGNSYTYDAAGNILSDGKSTYTFDGWNRMLSAGSAHYTYGPGGERITKSDGTKYYYGPNGQVLTTFNADGTQSNYVYLGGRRLARIQWSGSNSQATSDIKYYLTDALGSTDKFVDKDGVTILDDQDYFPFGGIVPGVGMSAGNNRYKFTGQERDGESGLDYFGARYYSSVLGRWISADWSAGPVPIPYADLNNPQSFNLYSYVSNSPESLVDETGHGYAGFDGLNRQTGADLDMYLDNFSLTTDPILNELAIMDGGPEITRDNIQSRINYTLNHYDNIASFIVAMANELFPHSLSLIESNTNSKADVPKLDPKYKGPEPGSLSGNYPIQIPLFGGDGSMVYLAIRTTANSTTIVISRYDRDGVSTGSYIDEYSKSLSDLGVLDILFPTASADITQAEAVATFDLRSFELASEHKSELNYAQDKADTLMLGPGKKALELILKFFSGGK